MKEYTEKKKVSFFLFTPFFVMSGNEGLEKKKRKFRDKQGKENKDLISLFVNR